MFVHSAPLERRSEILQSLGARDSQTVDELLRYNENHFQLECAQGLAFPLQSEPCSQYWSRYPRDGQILWEHLVRDIPQLSFAIASGMSGNPGYLSATRRGSWLPSPTSLGLQHPEALSLTIHPTPAGEIPVFLTRVRPDFEALTQAFSKRNEPMPIPPSMGACMVAGLNNWGRVRHYREAWESSQAHATSEQDWQIEMASLVNKKDLYQDRFILLSDGPYSGISAEQMGVDEGAWRDLSLAIRWGHESAHYFTRRVLGSMRNNLRDELIADYCGIRKAIGRFESSWLLRFMGLENYPEYRAGGRLENYCVESSMSEAAFSVLKALAYHASCTLEKFDQLGFNETPDVVPAVLLALASVTLEELAEANAIPALRAQVARYSMKERGF